MFVGAIRAGASITKTITILGFSSRWIACVFRECQLRKRVESRVACIALSNRRSPRRQSTTELNTDASESTSQSTKILFFFNQKAYAEKDHEECLSCYLKMGKGACYKHRNCEIGLTRVLEKSSLSFVLWMSFPAPSCR